MGKSRQLEKRMAQTVGYFEDTNRFAEGPFVLCEKAGNFRIEAEMKGQKCPVLPDVSILPLIYGYESFGAKEPRERLVDWLNGLVRVEAIVCEGGVWVHKTGR
jgi:hypothetical protein